MIRYEATTLAQCVHLLRFQAGESRDETAAAASRYTNKTISREYVRRIEEPHKRAGLTDDTVDPLVIRALAAHFEVAVEDISPKVADKLERLGIPPIDLQVAHIAGYRRAITEDELPFGVVSGHGTVNFATAA